MKVKNTSGARMASLAMLATIAATSMAQAAAPEEIVIPGEKIFPESLTSTADGTVILGSVGARTIWRAKSGSGAAEAWIQPGTDGMQGIFGVFADDKSKTLWACSGGFPVPGAPPPAPSALYAFDLKTGASKGHYPLPTAGGFCNDIAIGADGTAYATDTSNMEVLQLKKGAKALEVWAGNGAFGPKGGVLDGISVLGKRVLVNTLATSKIFSIPIEAGGKAGTVAEVKLDRAIERPDGMRSFGKSNLLVVEGGGGGRLSKIAVDANEGKVTTIKEGYPDGPVAVTVVGTTGYVLEGQLGAMRGPPKPDAAPKPFHATAVAVGKP
jgi:sugar lactone lactonase YvrE